MQETTIGGIHYRVYRPYHSWDMNYHFIDDSGNDHLVDLQDVIDWIDYESASVDDAIRYAHDRAENYSAEFWWKRNAKEVQK